VEGTIDSPGPEGVFRLRYGRRSVFLLWRGEQIALIGAGGPEHMPLLRQTLEMRGAKIRDIKAILLTHADVMLNANADKIHDISGAKVYAHRLDAPRLELRFPHTPRHAVRARMEKKRAKKVGYLPCPVDFYVGNGDVLDLWYSLSVIHLPGPTPGHCGYYCRHLNTLFCGGLMEERTRFSRFFNLPPFDEQARAESIAHVEKMKPDWTLKSVD